jgi:hypothetical protein
MKSPINICFAIGILLLLTTCGDNNPASTNDDDPVDPNVESKEIGPAGGNLTSKDGLLTLTIPAGALVESQTITVEIIAVDDLGSEFSELADAGGISGAYELGPDGLQFDEPITVKFQSNQTPVQTADSIGVFSEFLLTSSGGSVELLDSLVTHIDIDNSKIEVEGQLSHFSPLVTSQANNGVSFFVFGVPDELEIGSIFSADAKIFGSASGSLAEIVTVPGPATYKDRSGTPIVPVSDPPSGELTGNSADGFAGTFNYGCSNEGLGIYSSDLSVQVVFNLNSEEIRAESFANFLTTVECVPEALPAFSLTAELAGDGAGTVTSEPAGIDCPGDCTEDYTQGNDVILDANPAEGSKFVNWTGDLGDASPDSSSIILKMDQDRNVTAVFSEVPSFTLEVLKDGAGTGSVTSDPPGIDYGDDNKEDYPENTVVTLTVTPDEGSVFSVWSEFGVNISNNPVINITMDKARTLTVTFDEEEPSGSLGVFPSGTNFPREIMTVPNPWGDLTFPSSCPYIWVLTGQDVGFVDPCSGTVMGVADIPFEVSSTGLNGGIPLFPVIDNLLLLTTQGGWFKAKLEANSETGDIEISEFSGTDIPEGFIHAAGPNLVGGTTDALVVGRKVQKISADLSFTDGYPELGEDLLGQFDENFNPWNMTGSPRQASTDFTSGTPGNIVGTAQHTENGSSVVRAYYAMRLSNGDYEVMDGPEIGGESNDFTCEENPNPNPASDEAIKLCFSVDRTSDGIRPVAVFDDEANPIQVLPVVSTTNSPTTVASRLTLSGEVEIISASFFGGEIFRGVYDFRGNLTQWGFGSYPSEIDGVHDISFDSFERDAMMLLGGNSNNIWRGKMPPVSTF